MKLYSTLVFLVTLLASSVSLASMSEIDLMVREELVKLFKTENIKIQSEDIQIAGFVPPHDEANCDIEVASIVKLLDNKNTQRVEHCNVCFRIEEEKGKIKKIEPQTSYCI